jgi:peroxiredoxin
MSLPRLVLLAALVVSPILPALHAQEVVPTSALPSGSTTGFLKAGDVAPEFSVLGPKGETIKLSDFRGKIVIVDVSATWCGPCQAAMPNNDRVFKKYADQGVVLLGVTADDTRAAYDGWIKRSVGKYTFTMTFDLPGKDGWKESIFNTGYRVTGFPMMFVIGRDGKILETVSGGGPGEDYRLEYALVRAGVKVDLASIPAEPKKDLSPKSIPMMGKTPAMPAATKGSSIPMIGMGGAPTGGYLPAKFGSIAAGENVTDFTVTGPDDKPIKLSDFRGSALVLHFNTSNGPQPWISEIAATYKDQGLAVLAVFSATERADFDAWRAKNPNPGFAIAWDPSGKSWAEGVTNTGFGVGMFPATVVIDATGKLVSGSIGMGPRAGVLVKGMLAKSKAVKLTANDAAPVIEALLAADAAKTSMAAATIKPMPGAAAGGGMTATTRIPTLAAGAGAPDFVMKDLAGKDVRLSDYKGKIVILDFWATWCGPCLASFPHTQEVAAKYKNQDVVVLASGTSDTIEAFKKWIPANQPKFPNLLFVFDPHERGSDSFDNRASSKLYHVVGIPTQFVIGRDGKIAATLVGYDKGDARSEAVLAKLGVKVDDATVTEGNQQLIKDAAAAITQAAADKNAEKNPPAPFRESFGKLAAGATMPDFDLLSADGKIVKFFDYAKGKTAVIGLWSAGFGPPEEMGKQWDALAKKYADVVFIGIGGFQARDAFEGWLAKNPGKYSFLLTSDPAGGPPKAPKPTDDMTPEEKKAYGALSKAYYDAVVPMKLGGIITPVPTTIVVNPEGKLAGWSAGYGPNYMNSLGNLLLRAGVKLAAEDMPAKVYTAAETKEAPPEARVEMLKVGATAPDFTTTDINGKPVKISDFKSKVVILDFWAPWCGPCIASMPHTNEVAATYKDQGVVVLGSCTSDTRANFDKWVKTNQEKYPDFIFSHDAAEKTTDRASRKLYGVSGIPTQFIIDREGKIAAISIGYLKGEVLLEGALAKAGVKVDPAIVAKAVEDQKRRDAR